MKRVILVVFSVLLLADTAHAQTAEQKEIVKTAGIAANCHQVIALEMENLTKTNPENAAALDTMRQAYWSAFLASTSQLGLTKEVKDKALNAASIRAKERSKEEHSSAFKGCTAHMEAIAVEQQ